MSTDYTSIVAASVPVSDLARSVAFYREALALPYAREFTDGTTVTGCTFADFEAGFMISLRHRAADLSGDHPVIVGVPDRPTVRRVRARLTAAGFAVDEGEHADAAWLEVIDPDGIALRFAVAHAEPQFIGVTPDGFYHRPRLG